MRTEAVGIAVAARSARTAPLLLALSVASAALLTPPPSGREPASERRPDRRSACSDPSSEKLLAQLAHAKAAALQSTTLAGRADAIANCLSPLRSSVALSQESFACEQQLAGRAHGSRAELRQRSVCPWFPYDETDANRYPATLTRARYLSCTNSAGNSGYSSGCGGQNGCQVVTVPVVVLRRTSRCNGSGEAIYAACTEHVGVAYVCARRPAASLISTIV